MAMPHTHLNLADVADAAQANGFGHRWEARVAREALGAEQMGLTHFRLRPGKRSPFMHRHGQAEEVYVVLGGNGRIKLDDEIVELGTLDAIRVAPVSRWGTAGWSERSIPDGTPDREPRGCEDFSRSRCDPTNGSRSNAPARAVGDREKMLSPA
jgi:quercetin dioxygenase-like cupin family protein